MSIKNVPVEKLKNVFNLLQDESIDIWGDAPFTTNDIAVCLDQGILESKSHHELHYPQDYRHAARIAFLIKNKDLTPIQLDVGIPSLGYHEITLIDGFHRAIAAIMRGDKTIKAEVGGETAYYQHLFIRPSAKYAAI